MAHQTVLFELELVARTDKQTIFEFFNLPLKHIEHTLFRDIGNPEGTEMWGRKFVFVGESKTENLKVEGSWQTFAYAEPQGPYDFSVKIKSNFGEGTYYFECGEYQNDYINKYYVQEGNIEYEYPEIH